MRIGIGAAALAVAAIAAQPCAAASFGDEGMAGAGRIGAFAGVALALPVGALGRARPSARLQLSPVYAAYDRSGFARVRPGGGLALGLEGPGKLGLRLAGSSPAELKRRIGFKGSTGYIVVGGLLVGVLLLAAVANAQPKPGPRPGDFPSK
jgi:hypothetical protein